MQAESTCIFCRRLRDGFRCEAFPQKIPDEILNGWADHTKPYPGDNGIRFEPIPGIKTQSDGTLNTAEDQHG